ncbi:zinc finger CCCH domain-containing protein 18 [Quillaja saponaria]|uniref:Zinc finger CCCH domain-containing protein 18 n=1 Tax=Quillaja saponaria TaxID=32244 RepID=A0AAD7PN29_QUISA|nr:zinc finger CCCH domain-containing protein 18 [Quillaja saponaria]
MASEEERLLENQLELQLKEQRDSLDALNEALRSDPENPELLAVHEELVQAIKDAEEGLLHLKRSRLLHEADLVLHGSTNFADDEKVELLDPTAVEPEPLQEQCYSVGSKCRFRHTDGRWYNGRVVQLGISAANISFLTPTSERMLMCKFFLQQRCRFGADCRLSHGIDVPLISLKKYVPTIWKQSLAGSTIWAVSDGNPGIWREAELESWDEAIGVGEVVFRDDGSSTKLGEEAISLSEYAEVSDEETESSTEQSDYSENEDEMSQGIGFLESTNLQRGIQTDTTIFAKWENHTRGIASKMMSNMGYREGMGLGVSGEECKENKGKKRSRGGKRKRGKKFAAAVREAKEEEDSGADVFTLINNQLAQHGEALNGGSVKKQLNKGPGEGRKVDRRALIAYEDEVKDLKIRVVKLEEMASRNKKEKVVYDAAMRKLKETRKALADAESAHASASNAVVSREKEKKWLKF